MVDVVIPESPGVGAQDAPTKKKRPYVGRRANTTMAALSGGNLGDPHRADAKLRSFDGDAKQSSTKAASGMNK